MDEQDDGSIESTSFSTRSRRHSSQLGPYQQHIPETQFPLYYPVRTSSVPTAIYCRSLMSFGRGFPLWRPAPPSIPEAHLERGFSIGDVGHLDNDGGFEYYFNIFYPGDHPVQVLVPRNFKPIEPPFPEWKTQVSIGDISPGSILPSKGITATHVSEQPLEIEFTSYAREGAVLILPDGATREDLSEPDNLYPYLKEHASDWYQLLNGYSDVPLYEPVVNGTIFIITGTDRAKIWNQVQFPPNPAALVRPTIFRYMDNAERERIFDTRGYGASLLFSQEMGSNAAGKFPGALFIRGISIALGKPAWAHYIAPIPVHNLPVYCIPSVPSLGPRARLEIIIQHFRRRPGIVRREVMFHPAMVLLQILLEVAPTADIAIVQDPDWCPFMRGQSLDLGEFRHLVHRVLAEKEIAIKDGIAVFVQKPLITSQTNVKQKFQSCIRFLKTGSTKSKRERQALWKLNQLLSKPRKDEDEDLDSSSDSD